MCVGRGSGEGWGREVSFKNKKAHNAWHNLLCAFFFSPKHLCGKLPVNADFQLPHKLERVTNVRSQVLIMVTRPSRMI